GCIKPEKSTFRKSAWAGAGSKPPLTQPGQGDLQQGRGTVIESLLMKPSELPGARRLYRLTNRALAQIRELWQYAGEDELPPDSLVQAAVPALLLRTFPRPRRYPRLPRCRSALGSPLDARPARR